MPKSVFTDAYAIVVRTVVELRKEQGVSQVELARRLGKTQQFISYIEQGQRRIDVVELYAIVRALEADPETVFLRVLHSLPADVSI